MLNPAIQPAEWSANKFRTIYIHYAGRYAPSEGFANLECEFYYALYDQGFGYVNLCCPVCQKGADNDAPVDVSGDPRSCTLTIRREKKYFEVSKSGLLTVYEPITCSYCNLWSVRITNGVAKDSF